MVVYIDVLLFENFVVNLFLLILTFKLLRFSYKNSIYLSAVIGAIYTLALFLEWPLGTSFLSKVLVAALMIYIAIEKRKINNIFKCIGCFFMLSFTLAGISFSFALVENKYYIFHKFEINNYSIKYMLISVMLLYIFIVRSYEYLRQRNIVKSLIYDIEISVNKNIFYIKGFLDTGNELREPVTNLPCIIVEDEYLIDIQIPESEYFNISYSTIGEFGKIKGFKGEKIRIKSKDEEWRTVEAIICSCENKLSKENDFNALLSIGII